LLHRHTSKRLFNIFFKPLGKQDEEGEVDKLQAGVEFSLAIFTGVGFSRARRKNFLQSTHRLGMTAKG
jgi:hypothetical protein